MKIFPVYYFPPVSWFAAAIRTEDLILEAHIHYRKQQYFNRTRIRGANKVQNLSIPIVRTSENTPFHLRQISYAEDWQKLHWKSFEAAYRSSPYFEFYEDQIVSVFEDKFEKLIDLNMHLLGQLKKMLQLDGEWTLSEKYEDADFYEEDYRQAFDGRGNKLPEWFEPVEYRQVFPGFEGNLSITDLIFNMGPESLGVLRKCWKPVSE